MVEAGTVGIAVAVSVAVGDDGMGVSVDGTSVGIGEFVATGGGVDGNVD